MHRQNVRRARRFKVNDSRSGAWPVRVPAAAARGLNAPRKCRPSMSFSGGSRIDVRTRAPPPGRHPAAARGGRHCGARARAARRALPGRSQSRTAARGRDARRAGAGARRRRHRQDARADDARRAHSQSRPRATGRDPRRHLHQQGGAGNEGARGADDRAGRRGHALARHVPCNRRQDPAAPCRARRPQERLHHPRHRRPDPADQAARRSREARREAMAGEPASFANGRGKALYQAYQQRLKTLNAADFGDLLLECIRLFRQNPEVLRQYRERFRFILVDEYQDTNTAQYLWLKLLAQPHSVPGAATGQDDAAERGHSPEDGARTHKNICCVGDDDQSIYGWRGADVDNILRFEHDFPGARIIRLETNYRSTGHIVAAASHLIAHNKGRLGKTLHTQGVPGEKVQVTACWDSEEEARAIGEEIEAMRRAAREDGADHRLDEIAILVRASFQMREFEDRFIQLGLPYRVIGGPRFYERAEIRDALAYLRVIAQPADDLAFERILNVPKRGLGDAALQMLNDTARRKRIPLLEAARLLSAGDALKPKPRAALRALVGCFDRWRGLRDRIPHTELAEIVLDESGYTEMWQKDRSADAAGRLENLKELVRSMEEFENLTGFLEHVALVMDADAG